MEKLRTTIFLLICLSLFSSCQGNNGSFLNDLPKDYSLTDAKSDGLLVLEDGTVTSGQQAFDLFLSRTEKKEAATLKIANYYSEKNQAADVSETYPKLFFSEVVYQNGKYKAVLLEDGKLTSKSYDYLLKYEGEPRSEAAFSHYLYYVLVNDNTVTWEDILDGMTSSQSGEWIDHYKVYAKLT